MLSHLEFCAGASIGSLSLNFNSIYMNQARGSPKVNELGALSISVKLENERDSNAK